jgi:hypothetical protein
MSRTSLFCLSAILCILLFSLSSVTGCTCGDGDDDDDPGDDDAGDDDDPGDDDAGDDDDDDDWIEPTAWDDFLAAEKQLELANFSTAMNYYDSCILKLQDQEPLNDGPVELMTLQRAQYGYVITLTLGPLRIIEAFLGGALDVEAGVKKMEDAVEKAGYDPDDLPTSLLTVYLKDVILPMIEIAVDRIDAVCAVEQFVYPMPPIRLLLFNQAIEIPAIKNADGKGEHDRTEAHLIAAMYHLVVSSAQVVTSQNIDSDLPRIDEILALLMSGDIMEILAFVFSYPDMLTLHDDQEIDGPALMATAHLDWIESVEAFTDDNDKDGVYFIDDNGTPLNPADDFPDPGELPDDFFDSLMLEADDQLDDIIRRSSQGSVSLNVELNGQEVGQSGLAVIVNLVLALLTDTVMAEVTPTLLGFYPPEMLDQNGLDDDLASGVNTALTAMTLTDSGANFAPEELVGFVLNPNVAQPEQTDANVTFQIVANTTDSITVQGDMTAVAEPGDEYSVGDGWIDDRPLDLSSLLGLLIGNFIPNGAEAGFYLAGPYDNPSDLRDALPLWDETLGDPAFYGFVVDRTETYDDLNGNGRYDPGVDTFTDAAHVFGPLSFPADGAFQPYYLFFQDGTMAGSMVYGGLFSGKDPTDCLNRIVSGLLMLIGGV